MSPSHGVEANRLLVAALEERLFTSLPEDFSMTADQVRRSLSLGSAKLWIDENGPNKQPSSSRLAVQRWVQAYAEGRSKAYWGLNAPIAVSFEVKGGFVNADGTELVAPLKHHRAIEINEFGWS